MQHWQKLTLAFLLPAALAAAAGLGAGASGGQPLSAATPPPVASATPAPGGSATPAPGGATTALPGHVLPALTQAQFRPRAAASPIAASTLLLTLVLKRSDQAGFDAYLRGVQDPQSPTFQRFLSAADLTARFGPSQQAYDAVLAYLQQQGFSLSEGSANRLTLTVSGSRSAAEQAFGVQIGDFQLGGRTFFANINDPALPSAIAAQVQAIAGLNNLAVPHRAAPAAPASPALVGGFPTPMEMATAYDFGSLGTNGAGQRIGVIEYSNYTAGDVSAWLALVGLPAGLINNIVNVNVNGGTGDTSANLEDVLDIDVLLGMAPGALINVYIAPNGGANMPSWSAYFNRLLGDGNTVISNSWGNCEADDTLADVQGIDSVLAQAAGQGVSVFTASGDNLDSCVGSQTFTPGSGVPADSPSGVAVGGTTLNISAGGGYVSETFWNSGRGWGAGFGTSAFFGRPSYQNGFTASAQRSIPDISAAAGPGVQVYYHAIINNVNQQVLGGVGGTSMATPIWAASLALLNQKLGHLTGNLNATLYAANGTNAFHSAASMGSDFAHVGLGSLDLGNLYAVLNSAVPRCTAARMATTPAGNAAVGASVTLSVTSTTGCSNPRYEYWILPPGGSWTLAQNYTSSSSFSWSTTGQAPGSYTLDIWVKDAGSPTANYDTYTYTSLTLFTPCTAATMSTNPAAGAMPGTPVTLTVASTTGCPNPRFAYWVSPPAGGWQQLQAYTSNSSVTWGTTGLAPGTYLLDIWAKDTSSPTPNYDTYTYQYFTIGGPCTSATVSPNPSGSTTVGTTVTIAVSSAGCLNPRYEYWISPPSGGWQMIQAYTANNSVQWNTTGLARGTYILDVWAKDTSSSATYDTYGYVYYTLR